MRLFWQRGFSGGSMQRIVKATGLKPGSIYLAFGNKEGLYRAALKRYAGKTLATIGTTLSDAESVTKGICELLEHIVNESVQHNFCSCFLIRSRLELPPDSELHKYCGELLQSIEYRYAHYLSKEFDEAAAKAHATSLMLHIFGVRVYSYHSNRIDDMRTALQQGLPWLPWDVS